MTVLHATGLWLPQTVVVKKLCTRKIGISSFQDGAINLENVGQDIVSERTNRGVVRQGMTFWVNVYDAINTGVVGQGMTFWVYVHGAINTGVVGQGMPFWVYVHGAINTGVVWQSMACWMNVHGAINTRLYGKPWCKRTRWDREHLVADWQDRLPAPTMFSSPSQ